MFDAYRRAAELLRTLGTKDHGSGANEEEIAGAERAIGVQLPEDYKLFLRDLGWGGAGHWELYGLGEDVPSHLDLVDNTHFHRTERQVPVPATLVPIMDDGGGNAYCFDTERTKNGRAPIVLWYLELEEDQVPEDVAPEFASWFQERVQQVADGT